MSDLSRKMAGGAAWMIGARMVMRLSGLINVVILARLLPPADFGVVGLTVAFIAAFEAMSDMSLNAALVRHPDPKRKHYDTVFSLMALRGIGLASIAYLAAEPMAAFYGDDRLATVAHALAAQQLILGFLNPGVSDFQRDFSGNRIGVGAATNAVSAEKSVAHLSTPPSPISRGCGADRHPCLWRPPCDRR
jgi:PST family polysaccharide transporter